MLQDLNNDLSKEEFSVNVAESVADFGSRLLPADRLRLLFDLENKLYNQAGRASIEYNNGIHTKHRHIQYHQFFINRISVGSKVLDIGCGNGALAQDIASNVRGVNLVGVDLNPDNIACARKNFSHQCIEYICGDVLEGLPVAKFDYIVMSNVLEHLPHRVEFLKQLVALYSPKSFLIRVPVYERDWRVPLKQELNVDYRLDHTHYIEYKSGEFEREIAAAGMNIKEQIFNWGEIWAECLPIYQ